MQLYEKDTVLRFLAAHADWAEYEVNEGMMKSTNLNAETAECGFSALSGKLKLLAVAGDSASSS